MKLTHQDIQRLEQFLTRIAGETYPEPLSPMHSQITQQMWQQVKTLHPMSPGAKILDVGCGQGVALELFKNEGFSPVGITINPMDLDACRARGFDAREM